MSEVLGEKPQPQKTEVMTERPILFSYPMVRAIINGTKTQTRRIVKPQPDADGLAKLKEEFGGRWEDTSARAYRCPGKVGDVLWVRETWNNEGANFHDDFTKPNPPYYYAADYDADANKLYTWKPSIFMPRAACRIRLEVVAVRVERLQRISEPDAISEGVGDGPQEGWVTGPVVAYADLWDSINGRDAWLANPWVWVIEFKRIEA